MTPIQCVRSCTILQKMSRWSFRIFFRSECNVVKQNRYSNICLLKEIGFTSRKFARKNRIQKVREHFKIRKYPVIDAI